MLELGNYGREDYVRILSYSYIPHSPIHGDPHFLRLARVSFSQLRESHIFGPIYTILSLGCVERLRIRSVCAIEPCNDADP